METWRPVVGFEGFYEVSDHGNVRSVDRVVQCGKTLNHLRGKTIRGSPSKGYPKVMLYRNAKHHSAWVHRLVAEAFLGPRPDPLMEVAHYDGDRSNCHASNLRWATHEENIADTFRHGRIRFGADNHTTKLTPEQVREIRGMLKAGMVHDRIAEQFGVSRNLVTKINNNSVWRHLQ